MFAFVRRPAGSESHPDDWVTCAFDKFMDVQIESASAPLDFAGTLSRLAKARGFNQSSFARLVGNSPRRMGHYFNGERRPDYELLLTMADALGVHVGALLGRSPDPAIRSGLDRRPKTPEASR